MIEIRKTEITELAILMDIFKREKRITCRNGNAKQWTGGYLTEEIIKENIENGSSYIYLDEGQKVIGTLAFMQEDDPAYAHIYDDAWIDNRQPYGAIHRLTSTEDNKGVTSACLQWCYRQIPSLRADTYRDSHTLQYILKKYGFQYCGIIHLLNGDE